MKRKFFAIIYIKEGIHPQKIFYYKRKKGFPRKPQSSV
ncbi:hypothetical protein B4135_0113 [Caldibacillus debilis]|uniref:Uncharacterized protein n=1 Tax=Caldibacillus debilis TaxID=301148 RepID=A0A150M8M8_9BACI|nr:hypothetical protein B4135_0113 [Caldibacillus debilis]